MFRISLFLLAFCALYVSARTESTSAYGYVRCKKELIEGVEVRLIDHHKLSKDVVMNVTKTDQYGTYSISGWNDPSFGRGIHPVINIYHSCGAGSCYQLSIPKEYITKGRNPVVSFNAPDVELSVANDNC